MTPSSDVRERTVDARTELNRRIHVEVMGVVWDEARCRVCGWMLAGHVMDGCVADNCAQRPAPLLRADRSPDYAGSISAAWLVVEKMRAEGFEFGTDSIGPGWRAWFWHRPSNKYYRVEATDAPQAICLAALKLRAALAVLSPKPTETDTNG